MRINSDPHNDETEEHFELVANYGIAICGMLVISLFINHLIHKYHVSWLPESLAAMFLGALIGAGYLIYGDAVGDSESEEKFFDFSPEIFFFALLPLIILQAGYSLKRRDFFKNMGAILYFAVLGTIISSGLIGFVVYEVKDWCGIDVTFLECMLFGTVISATESVAILALLGNKELGADATLHALVFGESVFNDAVAIVLFHTLLGFTQDDTEFAYGSVANAIGEFFLVSFGSIFLGTAFGLICSMTLKHIDMTKHPANEFIMVFITAFGSYCAAELLQLSGVMAIFFCMIMCAHYNWYNLSAVSRASTRYGFEALAFAAETFVFVYLGITLAYSFHPSSHYEWSPKLIVVVIALVFISRAVYIFPFSALANLTRSRNKKITLNMQIAIWFSGMRGSVSFALALNIPSKSSEIVTTTLAVVLFTLVVCGVFMEKLVKKLGLTNTSGGLEGSNAGIPDSYQATIDLDDQDGPVRDSDIFATGGRDRGKCSCVHFIKTFDHNYMKKMFGGNLTDRTYVVDDDNRDGDQSLAYNF